jgi:hypothetical protein
VTAGTPRCWCRVGWRFAACPHVDDWFEQALELKASAALRLKTMLLTQVYPWRAANPGLAYEQQIGAGGSSPTSSLLFLL